MLQSYEEGQLGKLFLANQNEVNPTHSVTDSLIRRGEFGHRDKEGMKDVVSGGMCSLQWLLGATRWLEEVGKGSSPAVWLCPSAL